jgi:hypothetical protein
MKSMAQQVLPQNKYLFYLYAELLLIRIKIVKN